MLNTVKQIGFKFVKRAFPYIYLKVLDEEVRYELKALLPFDPVRKIMSVIVMSEDGKYILFSKGADEAML